MQIGSLVHCIDNSEYINIKFMACPELTTPYFIRYVTPKGTKIITKVGIVEAIEDLIFLQEIVNPICPYGHEIGYLAKHFAELLPPGSIQAEIEQTELITI